MSLSPTLAFANVEDHQHNQAVAIPVHRMDVNNEGTRCLVDQEERRERLPLRVAPLLRLGHSAQGGARAGAEKGPCGAAHSAQ
jgi:hypothetical protein